MSRFRVSVVGTVLFLVVAVVCVLLTSRQSAARSASSDKDVNIVNPLPLPVTGTLGLANGSAVAVNNPATSPVLVRDVDRGKPFQKFFRIDNSNHFQFAPLPAGERWVVEHVSFDLFAFNPGTGFTCPRFTLSIGAVTDFATPQQTAAGEFIANIQTKFIVEPGQTLSVDTAFSSNSAGSVFFGFISGIMLPAE